MSTTRTTRNRAASALDRRVNVPLVVATSAAIGTLLPVAAHQFGVVKHLPDPPGGLFASDRITGSPMAHPFGIPDSVPGLASYGTTLALALLAPRSAVARRLLGGKLAVDGAAATFNFGRQIRRFGKLCSWCTGTVVCTALMVYAGRQFVAETTETVKAELS